MVDKKMSLEKAINKFIDSTTNKSYRIEDVILFIAPLLKKVPYNIYISVDRILRKDRRFFYDIHKELYVPRAHFFKNAQFLIKPTQEEIKDGILYPGHRFIPFCYWEVFPSSCQVKWNKHKLKTKPVEKPFQNIVIYHTLLSKENIIGYLLVDSEKNTDVFNRPNIFSEKVHLNVFDIKNILEECNFQFGDFFMATVKDWKTGKYTLEHCPFSQSLENQSRKQEWNNLLEENLLETFEQEGTLTSIYEQLGLAFFKGGKRLMKNPPLHIGGFLAATQKIAIASLGMTTILWRQGESPEDAIDFSANDFDFGMTGDNDTIDGILQDVGIALNEQVLEAFMRDDLYQGEKGLDHVLFRCLPPRELKFYDKEQKKSFEKLVKTLWKNTKKNYNIFCDKTSGKYRQKALSIIELYYKWLYELEKEGIEEKNCPKRETLALGEMQVMLMHLVSGFNGGDTDDLLRQKDMSIALNDIEHSSKALMEVISKEAKKATQPKLQIVPSKELQDTKAKTIYQLKISLLHTKPLVWRRIQIPGEISLNDLNLVFQSAMGWQNNHDHLFFIDGKIYGDPENQELQKDQIEIVNERFYELQDLVKDKESFVYEYDLEDSWEHKIKVEKIITNPNPPKDKIYLIKCISGKNACPPENCGGVYGYDEMLQILKDPKDPEYKELKLWLKNFNPKYFDLEKVNKILQENF